MEATLDAEGVDALLVAEAEEAAVAAGADDMLVNTRQLGRRSDTFYAQLRSTRRRHCAL